MVLYENTVFQFRKDLRSKKLVNFLCAEYASASGEAVATKTRYVWKYMLEAVSGGISGGDVNPECGVRIDLEDGRQTGRLILLFASENGGSFRYTVLGMYAGSSVGFTRAEDIVRFREGGEEWTGVHPVLQMNSVTRRLFRGLSGDEIQKVNCESAAWLFDCVFSFETDIISSYQSTLVDESPVFYAHDAEDLSAFLAETLRGGEGIAALHKLQEIEKLSSAVDAVDMNEDQIYLISSITNSVLRGRKAWYLIEGQTGTGKTEIIKHVEAKLKQYGKKVSYLRRGDKPVKRPDIIVLSRKSDWTFEQMGYADVCVYKYDGSRISESERLALEEGITAMAAGQDVPLYISHLKHNMAFTDGGKGMRWLVSRLTLANIRSTEYDPGAYRIAVVDSKNDFSRKKGIGHVEIPESIRYDEAGKCVVISDESAKAAVYQKLSGCRAGVELLCADRALSRYLKEETGEVEERHEWIRAFAGRMIKDGSVPGDSPENNEKIRRECSDYERTARRYMGEGAWNKLHEQSKVWIVSSLMAYDNMKKFDRMVDFSGVCVLLGKACELELRIRMFTRYIDYMEKKYGAEFLKKLPDKCKTRPDDKNIRTVKDENLFTLGDIPYILGIDKNGGIVNRRIWAEFEPFAREVLLLDPREPIRTLSRQLPVIIRIKDEYRNKSAHSTEITIIDARECIEYIVTTSRKLGELLDAYRE